MTAQNYNRLTATAATAIFLFLALVLARYSGQQKSDFLFQRPSTFFTDPSGARALLLVMQRLLPSAQQWRRPLNMLPRIDDSKTPSTLIVAGPHWPIAKSEAEFLDRWLRAGAQLILLTDDGWPIRQKSVAENDSRAAPASPAGEKEINYGDTFLAHYAAQLRWAKLTKPETYLASGSSIPVGDIRLRWQRSFSKTADLSVIAAADRAAVAVEIPVGKGRIVAVADPAMVSNGALRRSDNAVWLVTLIAGWGNGAVLVDEYHQGFAQKRGAGALTWAFVQTPWGWCALQIAAAGLLYLFVYRRRFGRISEPPTRTRSSPLESVEARAGVFQAARAQVLAGQLIVQNLCQNLTKAYGKSVEVANLDQQLEVLEKSRGAASQAATLRSLLARMQKGERLNDREFIEIGRSAGEIHKQGISHARY